ncbi:sigma 54-interacting transcriptional regulator [Virgibacillus kimchii]
MNNIYLEDIWNNLFECLIITDSNGDILHSNRPAMRLFSLNATSDYHTSIFELIPPNLETYFTKGKEITGISIDFGTKELLLTIKPQKNVFLLIFKDMTTIQRDKYELDSLKEKITTFDILLDQLNEGICVINTDQKILFYNKKMGEINKREPASIKNRQLWEAFPNLEEANNKLIKTLKLGRKLNHRETHFSTDGKEITILSNTYPLVVGKKGIGAVEVLKDITKEKEMEQAIRQFQKDRVTPIKSEDKDKILNNTRFKFENIIFQSREMGRLVEIAKRAATRSSSNVLLVGETGTGKELFAQSIHNESSRRDNKFIAQNCAALPESLLESILFGTTEGSFTGSVDRAGIFEQAHKGTLLLDEINSMSLNLQVKLLRVIQEKKVTRLGSFKEKEVDVRIIATINEDPDSAINGGRLREDLYYRLSVVHLHIQPLRNRKTDIPILIDFFIRKHSNSLGIDVDKVDDQVMNFLLRFSWPGNVRQLEHTIEGALNLIQDERIISFDHLSLPYQELILDEVNEKNKESKKIDLDAGTLNEKVETLEQNLIEQALEKSKGNITDASKKLGISRQNLNYKLKKHQIRTGIYK